MLSTSICEFFLKHSVLKLLFPMREIIYIMTWRH